MPQTAAERNQRLLAQDEAYIAAVIRSYPPARALDMLEWKLKYNPELAGLITPHLASLRVQAGKPVAPGNNVPAATTKPAGSAAKATATPNATAPKSAVRTLAEVEAMSGTERAKFFHHGGRVAD